MARIEWVKQRLDNWALWKDREQCGGLGFYSQSAFVNEAATTDRYRESIIPVDDVDASVTNEAVEALKPARSHLYQTLQHIYVKGVGIKEAARRLGRAESTVKAQLEQADQALSLWFVERADKRKRVFTP
ncbi:antiterminator Q family protein [Polaromonas jejuensis]|uniref:Antiterminator Q family protein n=1 Tax=Polaromonas jejuensis TaxID=457502 RepID=A0ABW0QIG6_9BURK|nr:antiterminator Q family protein [Polaromonas jejuensis]